MEIKMEYDDVAWERSEEIEEAWKKKVKQYDSQYQLSKLVAKSRGGTPEEASPPRGGSFNMVIMFIFRDGGKAAVRLAMPATSMFPEEKTLIEVATIRYIQAHTTIPVPLILDSGTQEQCPFGLGPFIVMEWAESDVDFSDALRDPTMPKTERPLLDPNIAENKLRTVYSRMAEVLVQLSAPTEERIGALSQVGEDEWVVDKAPLTFDSSDLVRMGTLPRSKTPSRTFDSSANYFEALADVKIQHLIHQRNDAINCSDDCRRKYVARQLFRKLARENKLAWPITSSSRPKFRLFNDDFRPTNVLAVTGGKRDFVVSGVVDWEWTYFAPPEFTYSPPWWLLIEKLENWPKGLDDWAVRYEQALPTFLDELRKVEDDYMARGRLEESDRLSDRMRKCWDSGDFWVFYAMRKSFAFDYIFWHKICPRFFGFGANDWRQGLELLDDDQSRDMEHLVKRKLEEMKTRELAWDYDGPGPEAFAVEEDEKEDGDEPTAAEPKLTVTVPRTEFEALQQEHEKLKQEHERLKTWVEERMGKLGIKDDDPEPQS
ncbi:phosphotransferase family protein [Phyllosticta capitalensis]